MTPVFEAVSTLIGERAAVALVERLGGAPIYVPEVPIAGSPLVLAIGHGPAARLCDHYAGRLLDLPSRSVLDTYRRREEVRYDLRRGLSASEVARRHGLTARHVRRIRAEEIT